MRIFCFSGHCKAAVVSLHPSVYPSLYTSPPGSWWLDLGQWAQNGNCQGILLVIALYWYVIKDPTRINLLFLPEDISIGIIFFSFWCWSEINVAEMVLGYLLFRGKKSIIINLDKSARLPLYLTMNATTGVVTYFKSFFFRNWLYFPSLCIFQKIN